VADAKAKKLTISLEWPNPSNQKSGLWVNIKLPDQLASSKP
jgi:hypothetical protein